MDLVRLLGEVDGGARVRAHLARLVSDDASIAPSPSSSSSSRPSEEVLRRKEFGTGRSAVCYASSAPHGFSLQLERRGTSSVDDASRSVRGAETTAAGRMERRQAGDSDAGAGVHGQGPPPWRVAAVDVYNADDDEGGATESERGSRARKSEWSRYRLLPLRFRVRARKSEGATQEGSGGEHGPGTGKATKDHEDGDGHDGVDEASRRPHAARPRVRDLTVTAGTKGEEFVRALGEPTRKGGGEAFAGGGASGYGPGAWLEWELEAVSHDGGAWCDGGDRDGDGKREGEGEEEGRRAMTAPGPATTASAEVAPGAGADSGREWRAGDGGGDDEGQVRSFKLMVELAGVAARGAGRWERHRAGEARWGVLTVSVD